MKKTEYCQLIEDKKVTKTNSWIMNIFLGFDQLANAFARGYPDNTISSRIGHFNHHHAGNSYWRTLEKIVDFTFKPIDGIHHCYHAYLLDKDEKFKDINYFSDIILFLFVLIFCIPLIFIIRIIAFIFPNTKSKFEVEGKQKTLKEINELRTKSRSKTYAFK